jgi:hypothetical protein
MCVRYVLPGLLGVILITGCGGSSAETGAAYTRDAAEIQAANHTYATAVAAGDAARACAVVTPSLVSQIQRAQANLGDGQAPSGCLQLVTRGARHEGAEGEAALQVYAKSRLINIRITGDRATFTVVYEDVRTPGTAERVNGAWKISCCVGVGLQ